MNGPSTGVRRAVARSRCHRGVLDRVPPLVIAHRGASGYRPEHTLASYELALRLGADVIEPDLVSTKDGVLVARHENEISGTTDVAERTEFADRKTTKTVDGTPITGWFTEDFTLDELKTLRARERIPQLRPHNTLYDGRYQVPTLQEVIDLAKEWTRRLGRRIAIYPETKHPSYFDSIGLSLEEPLARTLRRNGWAHWNAPVFVQSFEVRSLVELKRMIDVPLVQLASDSGRPYDFVVCGDPRTYADLVTPAGLRFVSTYADGLGPNKNLVIPRDAQGRLTQPTKLVDDAHGAGLVVHAWTSRNENAFLPAELRSSDDPAEYGDALTEYELFFRAGVDGLFSDHPDTAVEARRDVLAGARRAS
ncbi:MAG: glycerophosphodiester phosphodiesterase [Acidimicrobiia bacterium]